MKTSQVAVICVTFATLLGAVGAEPVGRLVGGQDVDALRQFSYHVTIVPFQSKQRCGGSILNAQWVITSAACIMDSTRLDLYFGKMYLSNSRGDYFSVSVNSDRVFVYPTNYDDLALIQIPVQLVFSQNIAPVNISTLASKDLNNRFAVMPGFPNETDGGDEATLKYGMFKVMDAKVCLDALGISHFNEYNQLCVQTWGDNPDMPCDGDFGNGLIVGWPAKSEIVGLFSMHSPSCNTNLPTVFTYLRKYLPWIQSMIRG